MNSDLYATIPITIEFGSTSVALLSSDKIQTIEHRLTSELSVLLLRLGLSGEPLIEFESVNSSRSIRVRVHGEPQPYSPDLMKRVWRALAPTDLRDLPETSETAHQPGFPDDWFKRYLARLNPSDAKSDHELVFEYLTRLVLEVIRERPACLVGPAQTAAYLRGGSDNLSHAGLPTFPEELSPVLKSLLDLGVSVGNKSLVLQASSIGREFGRSVEDIVEGVFAQLCPSRIEIHVHPQYLQEIISGGLIREPLSIYAEQTDESLHDLFRFMNKELFFELGIQVPDLIWVPSPEMREGIIAIKINERLGLPTPGLRLGELLVNASVAWLAALNVPAQPATNPANGTVGAVVAEIHKETIEGAGYTAWTLHEFVTLAVSGEIRRVAHRLLSVGDVEYQLARLEGAFPELVRAFMERYSAEDLTRLLRGLVREKLSIRDMRAVLERLLQYNTISIASNEYVVFDDRFVLREATSPVLIHSWTNYREFVRSGMKYYIGYKYTQDNRLSAYLIDQELEARLEAMATNSWSIGSHNGLTETEQEAFRDAVWARVRDVPATATNNVILTTRYTRAMIRELIVPELPDLPVVAYSELPPNVSIEPMGKISLR